MNTTSPIPAKGAGEIQQAAKELFATEGYDCVSINAIAEQAGVSKANVFHHFGSKESLYLMVLGEAADRFAERLEQLLAAELDGEARLGHFISVHLEVLNEDPMRAGLVLRAALGSSQQARDLVHSVFAQNFGRAAELFRKGQASGQFRNDIEPGLAAFVVLATDVFMVHARDLMRRFPDGKFAEDTESYKRNLRNIILNGIARKGPAS